MQDLADVRGAELLVADLRRRLVARLPALGDDDLALGDLEPREARELVRTLDHGAEEDLDRFRFLLLG